MISALILILESLNLFNHNEFDITKTCQYYVSNMLAHMSHNAPEHGVAIYLHSSISPITTTELVNYTIRQCKTQYTICVVYYKQIKILVCKHFLQFSVRLRMIYKQICCF